jgi:hypothetical protein
MFDERTGFWREREWFSVHSRLKTQPPNSFRHAFGVTPSPRGRLGLRRFAPEGTFLDSRVRGNDGWGGYGEDKGNRIPACQGNDGNLRAVDSKTRHYPIAAAGGKPPPLACRGKTEGLSFLLEWLLRARPGAREGCGIRAMNGIDGRFQAWRVHLKSSDMHYGTPPPSLRAK